MRNSQQFSESGEASAASPSAVLVRRESLTQGPGESITAGAAYADYLLSKPDRQDSVSGREVATFTLLAVAACLLVASFSNSNQPGYDIVWAALALAAYGAGLVPIVSRAHRRGLGIVSWKLGAYVLIWGSLAYGVATVTWSQPQTGVATMIAPSSVLRALVLIAVGMTMWAVGYLIGPGPLARRAAARLANGMADRYGHSVRSFATPWLLYALATAARVVSAATTGLLGYIGNPSAVETSATGYEQLMRLLALCAPLAIALAAIQLFSQHLRLARFTLFVLFAAEVAYGELIGIRGTLINAVLAIIVPYCAARRKFPVITTVIAAAVFILVLPYFAAYRQTVRQGTQALSISQAVTAAPDLFQQTIGHTGSTELPASVAYGLHRLREIDSTAIVMQRTPQQIPFLSPASLVITPLFNNIPRAIWTDKPILDSGYQFSRAYYGTSPSDYTSSAISNVGDLYRHGGWVPVLAGMLALGCVVRLGDDVFDIHSNPQAICFVLLFIPEFVTDEGGWIPVLSGIPAIVLLWVGVVAFSFRRPLVKQG